MGVRCAAAGIPPGNRLEKLEGDCANTYNIRIDDQWRICFRWANAGPEDVEIVDDHSREDDNTQPTMEPIHPGTTLVLGYLEPLGIAQHRVAVAIGVPPRRINEIVHGKRGITADTALCLARYFGTSERLSLILQSRYELEVERGRLGVRLDQIEPLVSAERSGRSRASRVPHPSVRRSCRARRWRDRAPR